MAVPKENERYNWQDYLSWPEDERWELIDGVAYSMSPAPARNHQKIVVELSRQVANFLIDAECEVFVAPFDVKLSSEIEEEAATVVQPDLLVCCDSEKLTDQGMSGAPEIAVEIGFLNVFFNITIVR